MKTASRQYLLAFGLFAATAFVASLAVSGSGAFLKSAPYQTRDPAADAELVRLAGEPGAAVLDGIVTRVKAKAEAKGGNPMDVAAHDAYLDTYLALVDRLDNETRAKVGPGYAFIFKYLYPRVYGLRKGGGSNGNQGAGTPDTTHTAAVSIRFSNPSPELFTFDARDTSYTYGCEVFHTVNGKNERFLSLGSYGTVNVGNAIVPGKRFEIRCKDAQGEWSPETALVIAGTPVAAGSVAVGAGNPVAQGNNAEAGNTGNQGGTQVGVGNSGGGNGAPIVPTSWICQGFGYSQLFCNGVGIHEPQKISCPDKPPFNTAGPDYDYQLEEYTKLDPRNSCSYSAKKPMCSGKDCDNGIYVDGKGPYRWLPVGNVGKVVLNTGVFNVFLRDENPTEYIRKNYPEKQNGEPYAWGHMSDIIYPCKEGDRITTYYDTELEFYIPNGLKYKNPNGLFGTSHGESRIIYELDYECKEGGPKEGGFFGIDIVIPTLDFGNTNFGISTNPNFGIIPRRS